MSEKQSATNVPVVTFAQIEQVFQSWFQQIKGDKKALELWNVLLLDLRQIAESKVAIHVPAVRAALAQEPSTRRKSQQVTAEPAHRWLVWSNEHMKWWQGGSFGYTILMELAGRYTEAEADAICSARGGANNPPDEVKVLDPRLPR